MKRAASALLCLVIALSLASPANAALAGSYRCVGRSDATFYFLEIVHHNPNVSTQNIKRIRAYDQAGTLFFDSGTLTLPVPGRGSFSFFVDSLPASVTPVGEDFSVIVNWAQGNDVAPPVSRANHYFFISGTANPGSMSFSACP